MLNLGTILKFIGLPFFAYLLGSIPFGLVLTSVFTSKDLKAEGSGNIGATNVRRVAGSTLGFLTLAGDILKGAFPVWFAVTMASTDNLWGEAYICLVALLAVIGHLYPVYTKFKGGGKGVATTAGCFLALSPMVGITYALVFILFICLFNRSSAGSLAAAAVLPIAVWEATGLTIMTGCAFIITIFIYFRHKDNIGRLLSGTETVIWK